MLVNGVPGVVAHLDGRPVAVGAFTVVDGHIAGIHILGDPGRLAALLARR